MKILFQSSYCKFSNAFASKLKRASQLLFYYTHVYIIFFALVIQENLHASFCQAILSSFVL